MAAKLCGKCIAMIIGEFVVGIHNGIIEPYQTEGAEKLLPDEEFQKLWTLKNLGVFIYLNPEQRVIAKTTVTAQSDGEHLGRKWIINHTVIAKYDATTTKDDCIYRFDPANINKAQADKLAILNKAAPEPLMQPLPPIEGGEI